MLCAFLIELCLVSTKPHELHSGIVPGPNEETETERGKGTSCKTTGLGAGLGAQVQPRGTDAPATEKALTLTAWPGP